MTITVDIAPIIVRQTACSCDIDSSVRDLWQRWGFIRPHDAARPLRSMAGAAAAGAAAGAGADGPRPPQSRDSRALGTARARCEGTGRRCTVHAAGTPRAVQDAFCAAR